MTQPGVHLSDYSNDRSFPRLRDLVSKRDSTVRSSATVKEVIDDISVTQGPSSLVDTLQSHCHANPIVIDASREFIVHVYLISGGADDVHMYVFRGRYSGR